MLIRKLSKKEKKMITIINEGNQRRPFDFLIPAARGVFDTPTKFVDIMVSLREFFQTKPKVVLGRHLSLINKTDHVGASLGLK